MQRRCHDQGMQCALAMHRTPPHHCLRFHTTGQGPARQDSFLTSLASSKTAAVPIRTAAVDYAISMRVLFRSWVLGRRNSSTPSSRVASALVTSTVLGRAKLRSTRASDRSVTR